MTSERWQQVNDLFQLAAERAPDERTTFLQTACQGDEGLRREVESLIASYERAENFIESPAFEVVPAPLTHDRTGAIIGESIAHYQIESLIGVGGMGEVYLARDERLGRKVALKVLPERLTANNVQLSRFKSEARAASALNHPNILTVYEIGTEGNRHFIATEFIEGVTLRAALAHGKMSVHDALEIAVQVASALAAAHKAGVVHHDIKPENIMIRPDGYVKVLDFGLAKLTEQKSAPDNQGVTVTSTQHPHAGLLLGTPRYMSPEQTRGQPADARSDIWSLATVIYEMVSGVPAFSGATPSDCIASILKTEPPTLSRVAPAAPTELQSILQKALRKNRDERYQTTADMLADLRSLKGKLERAASAPTIQSATLWTAAVAAILLVGVGTLFFARYRSLPGAAQSPIWSGPAQIPEKSIAVLPFENRSRDPDNTYFADGIQEEILNRLSKISDLKVISRTSTQRYKSAPEGLRDIARRLGVANILEGTVQKTEGQVRVNVQLINARNDSHLWAGKYDRKLIDIFAVESEIAAKIVESLQAKLSNAEQKVLDARPTKSTEAYQLYLRARFLMEKRTADNVKKAAEYFKQAIAQDAIYAAAYAGLADCYVLLPNWEPDSRTEYLSKARVAANQALQIDGDLADAHVSLGMIAFKEALDLQEARREFERAIQLNPNYALAHYWLAYSVLLALGDNDRAIAGLERAIELDPVSSIINTNLGSAYVQARRYPEAISQLRKTIELEPRFGYAHAVLGVALELTGRLDEAFTEYERCYNLGDHRGLMMMAHVYGLKGDRAKALQSLEQARQLSSPHIWAYGCAMVYLGLGDRDEALAWLEQSYRQKEFINISTIKEDPLFDSLHGDPRFEKIVASLAPK